MRNLNKLFFVIITAITTLSSIAQNYKASVRKFITDSAKLTALVDAKIIAGNGGAVQNKKTILNNNGLI